MEAVPEWNAWFTWRKDPHLVPFGAVGKSPDGRPAWEVRSYSPPKVSVIIPVKSGYDFYLQDTLDSLIAQTYTKWEVILVNDGGPPLKDNPYLMGFPFVRVVEGLPGVFQGPAWARNRGVEAAQADLLVFLDADDYLQPEYLETVVKAYHQVEGGYIYTDWYSIDSENHIKREESKDWDALHATRKALHTITCLFPKTAWEDVYAGDPSRGGGFDERIEGWEDWEFLIAVLEAGYCGTRVAIPLFTYRFKSGRREESYALKDRLLSYITEHHPTLYKGKKEGLMACRGCPKGGGRTKALVRRVPTQDLTTDVVMIEYVGPRTQKVTYHSPRTNKSYRFDRAGDSKKYVLAEDVEPVEIVAHLPPLCDEKNTPYVYVPLKDELGKAAGLPVSTSAIAILKPGKAKDLIDEISKKVKSLKG